jgi:hypothetical protein
MQETTTSFSQFLETQYAEHLASIRALREAVADGVTNQYFTAAADGGRTEVDDPQGNTLLLASEKANSVFLMILDKMIEQQEELRNYWENPGKGKKRKVEEEA